MLGDDLSVQRIEVLLDIHTKKLQQEIKQLREELSRVTDDLKKVVKEVSVRQDAPAPQPQWQQAPPQQQWQQAPPQQPQWQQAGQPQWGQQAPPAHPYASQFAAASPPVAEPVNKWAQPPEKPPSTQVIDRNGVSPAEAQKLFQSFFYQGGKK